MRVWVNCPKIPIWEKSDRYPHAPGSPAATGVTFVTGEFFNSEFISWLTVATRNSDYVIFMQPVTKRRYLTITDKHHKRVRAPVVEVKPHSENVAVIHVTTSAWLDPHGCDAIYSTRHRSAHGRFVPFSCQLMENGYWLFVGTFTRALMH
jgi:hypothetical protein